MRDYNAKTNKTGGTDQEKPALIHTEGGRIYSADHHIRTDDGYVAVYLGDRSSGIDYLIPFDRVETIARSPRAQRELIDRDGYEHDKLIDKNTIEREIDIRPLEAPDDAYARSDAGCDALFDSDAGSNENEQIPLVDPLGDVEPVTVGALVNWKGEPWKVINVSESGQRVRLDPVTLDAVDLCPPGDNPTRTACVDELSIVERGERLVTDGGEVIEDVPTCGRCGGKRDDWHATICRECAGKDSMVIIESVDIEEGDRVEYDGREWTVSEWTEWHFVHLIADDGAVKKGVDVRELDRMGGCVRPDCDNELDIHGIGLDYHCSPWCAMQTDRERSSPLEVVRAMRELDAENGGGE
ncbi:MAG: hypothetical protein ACQEP0_06115 [Natrinema limicola]